MSHRATSKELSVHQVFTPAPAALSQRWAVTYFRGTTEALEQDTGSFPSLLLSPRTSVLFHAPQSQALPLSFSDPSPMGSRFNDPVWTVTSALGTLPMSSLIHSRMLSGAFSMEVGGGLRVQGPGP